MRIFCVRISQKANLSFLWHNSYSEITSLNHLLLIEHLDGVVPAHTAVGGATADEDDLGLSLVGGIHGRGTVGTGGNGTGGSRSGGGGRGRRHKGRSAEGVGRGPSSGEGKEGHGS